MSAPLKRRPSGHAERGVSENVEALVQTGGLASVLAYTLNLEARLRSRIERVSRRLLHSLNLPSATDVRLLAEQLSRLERAVAELRDDEAEDVAG